MGIARTAACLVAIAALLLGSLAWVVGRHVTDGPAFARLTLAALRTDAGVQVVTDRVQTTVTRELAASGSAVDRALVSTVVPPAVRDTLRSREFGVVALDALTRVHRVATNDRGIPVLDLNLVRTALTQRLQARAPQLAVLIPQTGDWGRVVLEPPALARHHAQLARGVRALRVAPWVCLILAVALGAAAATGPRHRAKSLRLLGLGALAVGVLVWAIGRFAPGIAGDAVSPSVPDGRLVHTVTASLLAGTGMVALVLAATGIALVLAARFSR